jgi:hypothetical protein
VRKPLQSRSETIHYWLERESTCLGLCIALAILCGAPAPAQTPPEVSIFRSVINDTPNQPLVTVTLTGASNSCFTIEDDLPGPATPVSGSVTGGGVWLPAMGAIRWGPFFNTTATNVSYRLAGPAGNYPVNGGSWMDGEWYFSPGITMVTITGGALPAPLPQLPSPIFMPPSGADVPLNVLIGMPGATMTLLDDVWAEGDRSVQDPPYRSAWFVSGSATNLDAATNALTLWPNSDSSSQIGILNLDATLYGDFASGANTYPLSLLPGIWQFLLVSPDLYPQATYWAWTHNAEAIQWHTDYNIYGDAGLLASGGLYRVGASPQQAFSATQAAGADKVTVTLTNAETLHLGVGDDILNDNSGGVSLRITREASVMGITYFAQNPHTPIALGVGDGLTAC